MKQFAYLHHQSADYETGGWRVYRAIVLKTFDEYTLERKRLKAQLLYVDDFGGIRIEEAVHYKDLTSAQYWVYSTEFDLLSEDVSRDFEKRHLWLEKMRDVDRITEEDFAGGTRHVSEPDSSRSPRSHLFDGSSS